MKKIYQCIECGQYFSIKADFLGHCVNRHMAIKRRMNDGTIRELKQ